MVEIRWIQTFNPKFLSSLRNMKQITDASTNGPEPFDKFVSRIWLQITQWDFWMLARQQTHWANNSREWSKDICLHKTEPWYCCMIGVGFSIDDLRVCFCIFVVSEYKNSPPQLSMTEEQNSDTCSRRYVLWFNISSSQTI